MSEKYEFIDAEYATMPAEGDAPVVMQMYEWLGVSKIEILRLEDTSAKRDRAAPGVAGNKDQKRSSRRIIASTGTSGSTRPWSAAVSHDEETVRKIMRDLGLEPCGRGPDGFR